MNEAYADCATLDDCELASATSQHNALCAGLLIDGLDGAIERLGNLGGQDALLGQLLELLEVRRCPAMVVVPGGGLFPHSGRLLSQGLTIKGGKCTGCHNENIGNSRPISLKAHMIHRPP